MEVIMLGFISFFIGLLIYKGIVGYKAYKGKLYSEIYSSYFEYIYKSVLFKNLAKSNWLQAKIGEHHILFHTYSINQTYYTLITIFCECGNFVLFDIPYPASFTENSKHDFLYSANTNRGKKTFKISKPREIIEMHLKHLHTSLQPLYVFTNDADFTKLLPKYHCIHYNELLPYLLSLPKLQSKEEIDRLFDMYKGSL